MKMLAVKGWGAACLLMAVTVANAQTPTAASAPAAQPKAQPAAEASTTFKRWDKNGDGVLSAAEFGVGWQEIQVANTLRNLHDNFVAKDLDRNGSLGPSEYLKLELVQKAGTSAPPMAAFDADKNQGLDFKEYVSLVGTLTKLKP